LSDVASQVNCHLDRGVQRLTAATCLVTLVVYENAPHGLYLTPAERVNRDLPAFIEGEQHLAAPLGRIGVL
jgi:hypothetical protein